MNRRTVWTASPVFRLATWALLAVLSLGVAYAAESAKSLYKHGEQAEAREDYDAAYTAYLQAFKLKPQDVTYKTAYYRVRGQASAIHLAAGRRLLVAGDEQGALAELLRAAEVDPSNESAQQEIKRVRALHQPMVAVANPDEVTQPGGDAAQLAAMASPAELKPMSSEPLTLHMVEDAKVVYQAVGKAAGVNVLFDPDFSPKRIQVDLNAVTLSDALRIVATLSNTFWRPVTANTIFVAADTPTKRRAMEELAVQTFYLTNAWQQNDLNDVNTALRNVLTSQNFKAYAVASQNAIVARGTPDELLLAQKIVDDLDRARPEVVVDIAVLEVSKNWERKLGLSWPQTASVAITGGTSSSSSSSSTDTSTTSTTPTLYTLSHLNSTDFSVTLDKATANMLLTDSDTKILQNPRIRATDAQKATMKIGSRNPIATGSYSSSATALTSLAETQFQYIDVGVNIELTPTVHYNHDVTMKLSIEVSSISGYTSISNVSEPIIAQKKSEQTIRLREGEASVLGGILNRQDIQSWSGLPGFSSIPFLKYLFGSKDHSTVDDEIVFLLVPHVVRSPYLTPANVRPIDIGSGQSIELRHTSAPVGPAMPPPARPQAEPAVGTVPGGSASAAAPAALEQMRSMADSGPATGAAVAAPAPAAAPAPPGSRTNFSLVPSANPIQNGSTFQVPVVITGAQNIAAVPLEVKYDPAKLTLVNVGEGDFLGRDSQPVSLVHRDDGPGTIVVNTTRPPGTVGVSGAGVVCVLSFQAKAAGETTIAITRPGAMTAAQQTVEAQGTQTTVVIK